VRAALILGHGAGGGIGAPDLEAAAQAAVEEQFAVALVEQPYRVAGRRAAPPAPHLDAAWIDVVRSLRSDELADLPLVFGGRSMGARVACRTAGTCAAIGVLCLAFPLLPPRRSAATTPPQNRLAELEAVTAPVLVVQGVRDRFGMPPAGPRRIVIEAPGDHGLKAGLTEVGSAVRDWLATLL